MEQIIFSAVESVLESMELNYRSQDHFFWFTISDENADFSIRIVADEEKELLVVIGVYPVKVPRERIDPMCRVLNDLNSSTTVGAFVIDPDDGELSFRIANNVDGGAINEEIVRMCILQVISRLRDTYDGIMAAMYGGPRMEFAFCSEKDATQS